MRAGGAFDITARLAGAFVSYIVVAVILLSSSVVLGLVVLLGVPVLVLLLGLRDQAAPGTAGACSARRSAS